MEPALMGIVSHRNIGNLWGLIKALDQNSLKKVQDSKICIISSKVLQSVKAGDGDVRITNTTILGTLHCSGKHILIKRSNINHLEIDCMDGQVIRISNCTIGTLIINGNYSLKNLTFSNVVFANSCS